MTLTLNATFSPAPLHPRNNTLPAFEDTATNVVEAFVSATSTSPLEVFKISSFDELRHTAKSSNAGRLGKAFRYSKTNLLEKLPTMVLEGRLMSEFGSFSVAENHSLSDDLSVPSSAVNGNTVVNGSPTVHFYLFEVFHHCAVSRAVDDSRVC